MLDHTSTNTARLSCRAWAKISKSEESCMLPKTQDTSVGFYSHMGGKIVTLVELAGGTDKKRWHVILPCTLPQRPPSILRQKNIPESVH